MPRMKILSVALICLVVFADQGLGQSTTRTDPKPRSTQSGHAGQALRQIYRQDIGTGFTASSQNSLALQSARARVPYVGQQSSQWGAGRSRVNLGLSSTRREKPFANATSRPTVSPYLNLFREDLTDSGDLNYQTLVRPQLQQNRVNQQIQNNARALSQRVQQISAQPAYNASGSQSQAPTGHQTVFGYHSRFYPGMARQQR